MHERFKEIPCDNPRHHETAKKPEEHDAIWSQFGEFIAGKRADCKYESYDAKKIISILCIECHKGNTPAR